VTGARDISSEDHFELAGIFELAGSFEGSFAGPTRLASDPLPEDLPADVLPQRVPSPTATSTESFLCPPAHRP
jgi:hypothetical protein